LATVKIFQSYLKTPFLILLCIEVVILFVSVYSASYLRFIDDEVSFFKIFDDLWIIAAIVATITPISMLATGLYQGQIREGMAGVMLRILISFIASAILTSLIFYLYPDLVLGRGIMAIAYLQSFFIIGTIRAIFNETVDTELFKKRVLVYGASKTAAHIDKRMRRKSDRRGFMIVGYVLIENQNLQVKEEKLVQYDSSLLEYAKQNQIDEIVVATSDMKSNIPVKELVDCKLNGIMVIDILSFFEREAGQIRIDFMDPFWLVTSEGFKQSEVQDLFKRGFDILASLIILTVASPFLIMTIIAIWIEEGFHAPIFYDQIRVGKGGIHYSVYKFRSMRVDAEKEGKAIWADKIDDRVTKVGAFIRKTRLDEFPQIYNVLNGSMSFVGPRPERPEFVETLVEEIPYYNDRHLVKPGVTGWAQLLFPYGSSVADSYQKQLFDMYYVKNHTLFLDCLILLQTVEVVLFGKGAR